MTQNASYTSKLHAACKIITLTLSLYDAAMMSNTYIPNKYFRSKPIKKTEQNEMMKNLQKKIKIAQYLVHKNYS